MDDTTIDQLESWVVGIRTDPNENRPTFFAIVVGDNFAPLLDEQHIVLTTNREHILQIASKRGLKHTKDADVPILCDIALALFIIENKAEDGEAAIVNALNTMFDCIAATKGTIPDRYRSILVELADHMTFSQSVVDFFVNRTEDKRFAIDGILWSVGWIMCHSRIIAE